MKNILVFKNSLFFILLGLGLSLPFSSLAQPTLKIRSRQFLKRTSVMIMVAHKKVKENKVYTGDLAKAVAHQRVARKMWTVGKYKNAIWHSARAREKAFAAFKSNHGKVPEKWHMSADEKKLAANAPDTETLEKEVTDTLPNVETSDEVIANETPTDIDPDGATPAEK